MSTASYSKWKTSWSGKVPIMAKRKKGARGRPYDLRWPNRSPALQMRDTTNEQVVFPAKSAPAGECDHMMKLVTNLAKNQQVWSERQGPY